MTHPENSKINVQQVNWTYIGMVSFIAAIGGLLFGFDTGVIAGTIGGIVKDFNLNPWQEGFAVSNLIIACILGSVLTGPLTDRFGRKRMLLLAGILFTLSAVLSGLPHHYWQLVVARFIGGLGVGIASVLSPIYIAELAPARVRGILVSVNQLAIVVGILLTYISNWLLVGMSDNDWRWMFEVEAVPALLFTLALFFIPESPRWLAKNNQDDKARDIFRKIAGDNYALSEMDRVRTGLEKEEGGLIELLNPRLRVLLFIGFSLAIFSNATGINVIIYYGTEIFKMAGFVEKASSFKAQMIIGLTNLLFTFAGMALIDRAGRKILHVFAYGLMTLSMLSLGMMFKMKDVAPLWMVIPVMTYVASFATGVGVVIWVYLSEMFPNKIRGAAMGIATMLIWLANFVVTQFFPVLRDTMGGNVFFLFTGASLIAFLFALIMMRETKGLHLEEIDTAFETKGHREI
ncbi:MAG: sugar porter family MFS transporter [Sedimentisphaerales bacterium]|nr:sugar porter family MFS transporter [Sedimentisphaerales bacterium]